jgi:hypothetical protein
MEGGSMTWLQQSAREVTVRDDQVARVRLASADLQAMLTNAYRDWLKEWIKTNPRPTTEELYVAKMNALQELHKVLFAYTGPFQDLSQK